MGRIQTGVDKLVALVKEQQRISVDEAAKQLGVSKTIIQEWADFLEEEGLVEIKYSLAKTYLVDRKLSKTETVAKERQLEQQRETFVTKVDQSISAIEREGAGFEQFRKEFQSLKGELGTSLQAVQAELTKLKHYEREKGKVTKTIHKERATIARDEKAAAAAIQRQYRRYREVLHAIGRQEISLTKRKQEVHAILNGEHSAGVKIAAYEGLLKALHARSRKETQTLGMETKTLRELERTARSLRMDLVNVEKTRLQPLIALREKHQKKLKALEHSILAKAIEERRHAKKPNGASIAARRKLEEFFRRRKVVEHLLEAFALALGDYLHTQVHIGLRQQYPYRDYLKIMMFLISDVNNLQILSVSQYMHHQHHRGLYRKYQ